MSAAEQLQEEAPLVRGATVAYLDQSNPDNHGLRGKVESDGVNPSGSVLIRWKSMGDPNISWTLLEDAQRLVVVS